MENNELQQIEEALIRRACKKLTPLQLASAKHRISKRFHGIVDEELAAAAAAGPIASQLRKQSAATESGYVPFFLRGESK